MDRSALIFTAIILILGIAIGAAGAYLFIGKPPVITETAKHVINHDDGTVTAPVITDKKPVKPTPSKPRGGTHVRTVEVTILPPQPEGKPVVGEPALPCPPLDLRIDFDRYPDGFRASVWSNGEILETSDYALGSFIPAPVKHSFGAAAFSNGTKQIEYTRFFSRVALSGLVAQDADKVLSAGIGAKLLLR